MNLITKRVMEYSLKNKFLFNSIYKNIELLSYILIGFVTPLFIGHPQILVGVIVNTILATSAMRNINQNKMIALAITPSIGAVMNGILFGNLTNFLLYFLPAIWISNFIYMVMIKWKNNKKTTKNKGFFISFLNRICQFNYIGAIFSASVVKMSILFTTAVILVIFNLVPKQFLIAMSIIQILTALTGGFVAVGIINIIKQKKLIKNNK